MFLKNRILSFIFNLYKQRKSIESQFSYNSRISDTFEKYTLSKDNWSKHVLDGEPVTWRSGEDCILLLLGIIGKMAGVLGKGFYGQNSKDPD